MRNRDEIKTTPSPPALLPRLHFTPSLPTPLFPLLSGAGGWGQSITDPLDFSFLLTPFPFHGLQSFRKSLLQRGLFSLLPPPPPSSLALLLGGVPALCSRDPGVNSFRGFGATGVQTAFSSGIFFGKISLLGRRYCAGTPKPLLPPSMRCDHVHCRPTNSIMVPGAPWLSQISRGVREGLESRHSLNKELEQTFLVKGRR